MIYETFSLLKVKTKPPNKADLRAAIFQCLDEKAQNLNELTEETQVPLSLCADLLESLGLYNTNKVIL